MGVRWAPNPLWLAFLWKEEIRTLRHTWQKNAMWTWRQQSGWRVDKPGMSDCQKIIEARKEAWKRKFPKAFRGSMALLTPRFWTSRLQDCETINFCCLRHSQSVASCYGSPSKGIHLRNRIKSLRLWRARMWQSKITNGKGQITGRNMSVCVPRIMRGQSWLMSMTSFGH